MWFFKKTKNDATHDGVKVQDQVPSAEPTNGKVEGTGIFPSDNQPIQSIPPSQPTMPTPSPQVVDQPEPITAPIQPTMPTNIIEPQAQSAPAESITMTTTTEPQTPPTVSKNPDPTQQN